MLSPHQTAKNKGGVTGCTLYSNIWFNKIGNIKKGFLKLGDI